MILLIIVLIPNLIMYLYTLKSLYEFLKEEKREKWKPSGKSFRAISEEGANLVTMPKGIKLK